MFLRLGKDFSHFGFQGAKFSHLCAVCLQTAITSSFQIQIMYRLKNYIPDVPSFKMIYGMHNLSFRKCFKNVSNSSEIWCGCNISISALHSRLQTAITSSFQIQITHRLKGLIPDFPSFETRYHMYNLISRKCFKNVSNSSNIFALEFARWNEFRTLNCGVRNGTLIRTLFRMVRKVA